MRGIRRTFLFALVIDNVNQQTIHCNRIGAEFAEPISLEGLNA